MRTLIKAVVTGFLAITLLIQGANPVLARRGCCSWHGGVSHCDTSVGRYVCNDGTYSPSCGCAYIPPKPKATTKPIIPTATPIPIRIATPTPQPIVQTTTSDSNSSDDSTLGWLTLVALGGGGYWLFKRAKNKKKPEETDTSEPTNQDG